MSTVFNVSEETAKLVADAVNETTLVAIVRIEPLGVNKQNVMIKVRKANPTIEFKCKIPETVFLYIYEDAFYRLETSQKKLLIKEALNQIHYDTQKDKLSIIQPQIAYTADGYDKWGADLVDCMDAAWWVINELNNKKKGGDDD